MHFQTCRCILRTLLKFATRGHRYLPPRFITSFMPLYNCVRFDVVFSC